MIESRVEYLRARGWSEPAAREEALRRVGGDLEETRHELHESANKRERRMSLHEQFDSWLQDVRYAARSLLRRPGFTVVAALTLAIGIGATTAIFSAVNVLLIRPLPYAQPDELMKISLAIPARGDQEARADMVWSYPKYIVFRDAQKWFTSLSLYTRQPLNITRGEVEQVGAEHVGAAYLRTLGLGTQLGRDFDLRIDAHPGAERQVILSDALWQRRYNADPTIIGQTIELEREPYLIIGVAPSGFQGLSGRGELFVPITTRSAESLAESESHEFYLIGRRRSGIDATTAMAGVQLLGTRLLDAFPGSRMGDGNWGATAQPLNDARIAPTIKRALLVLFGAVGFVMLIACANVANLVLGRASVRRREIAVRVAIGAGRARLVRLLLTESLLLALVGGIAGLALARFGVRALSTIDPAITLRSSQSGLGAVSFAGIQLDWTALLFALAMTLVVGVTFGVMPALNLTRSSIAGAIKDASATGRVEGRGKRRALVVAEVALALILLAGSGLMMRSLAKLLAIDTGFDARNVLTVRLSVPSGSMPRDSLPLFYAQMLERVRAVPGVVDVAIGNCPPLNGGCNETRMQFMDRPETESQPVGVHWASPAWFSTLRVPLMRGRVFNEADRMGTPKVVVINETAARQFWPNEDPIGKRVGVMQGGFGDGAEIIGLVGDVRQNTETPAQPEVYISYYQSPRPGMMIFARTSGDPNNSVSDVRAALREVAPQYAVYDIKPMAERAAAATAQARFSAILLGLFAATALALAIIGVYGVMALAVSARTREIGIRVALGADRRRIQQLVIGEGVALVALGGIIGLAGALWSTRLLRTLLYDLTPSDPVTYAGSVLLLVVAAVIASWIPARRAARVDPNHALRAE